MPRIGTVIILTIVIPLPYIVCYLQVAKENADVIILDDNFETIVNVAKWGRSVYINIQKFVQFQLTVNVVALMINFVSACISGSLTSLLICTTILSHWNHQYQYVIFQLTFFRICSSDGCAVALG